MSFLCTDTKGDLFRNYAGIAEKYYGYKISILDLRNPTRSDGDNILGMVNKYMDLWLEDPENLAYKARAEKYAKITAKTIISSGADSSSYGQNAFFYDAAEGLLTSVLMMVLAVILAYFSALALYARFSGSSSHRSMYLFTIPRILSPSDRVGFRRSRMDIL